MRIAILSKHGLERLVDETLEDLPLNQRLRVGWEETLRRKVKKLPKYCSYRQEFKAITYLPCIINYGCK